MNKHYLGQLQIEANVPSQEMINDFINVAVTFEILCPKCGPKNKNIKKNGHDVKLKGDPQIFYCNVCHKSFFAHTSWIFQKFTKLVIEKVIEDLFINNLSPKEISKRLDVSPSFITSIRYQCFNILKLKIDSIRLEANSGKKLRDLPLLRQSGIWWDETFFKINGSVYCLILIIDALGRVLAYKFSKTRTEDDYSSILLPIIDKLPEIPVFICDGNPTYEGVVKSLQKDCFLIQHIHSHPWKQAKLHKFIFSENSDEIVQTTIILPYDAFINDKTVVAFTATKKTTKKVHNLFKKKRGRTKGYKNKKKRVKYGSRKIGTSEKDLKTRGRKNLEKVGAKLSFNSDPYKNGWDLKLLSEASKRHKLTNPDLETLKVLINVTYEIMNGGAIQSNFIESKNSIVKRFLPNLGLKNVYQYDYLLGAFLYSKNDMESCYWVEDNSEKAFKSSLGFNNFLMFYKPIKEEIEVI